MPMIFRRDESCNSSNLLYPGYSNGSRGNKRAGPTEAAAMTVRERAAAVTNAGKIDLNCKLGVFTVVRSRDIGTSNG